MKENVRNSCVDVCVLFPPLLLQIPIATSGIRAMGYMIRHHLRTEGAAVSQRIITQFVKVQQEPDGHTLFTSPLKGGSGTSEVSDVPGSSLPLWLRQRN